MFDQRKFIVKSIFLKNLNRKTTLVKMSLEFSVNQNINTF